MPVVVRGVDEAVAAVGALSKKSWKDKELGRWADDERKILAKMPYPPTRPNQRYVRTYKLKHGYRVQKPRKMVRVITNVASSSRGEYGGYVVGQQQAYMHQGRWYIAFDIVEADLPALADKLGDASVRVFEAN